MSEDEDMPSVAGRVAQWGITSRAWPMGTVFGNPERADGTEVWGVELRIGDKAMDRVEFYVPPERADEEPTTVEVLRDVRADAVYAEEYGDDPDAETGPAEARRDALRAWLGDDRFAELMDLTEDFGDE